MFKQTSMTNFMRSLGANPEWRGKSGGVNSDWPRKNEGDNSDWPGLEGTVTQKALDYGKSLAYNNSMTGLSVTLSLLFR